MDAATLRTRAPGLAARRRRHVLAVGVLLTAAGRASADGDAALRYLTQGDCRKAAEEINRGLDADEARSYFLAGYLYDVTGCVEPDPGRAAAFYGKAIERGDAEARNFLGLMYGLGRGVPQDYVAAFRWFTYPVAGRKVISAVPEKQAVTGYAMTITQLARSRVSYPPFTTSVGTVIVTLNTRTGSVSFSRQDGTYSPQTTLFPSTRFTNAIGDAYEQAFREAPRTPEVERDDIEFAVPWTFNFK